ASAQSAQSCHIGHIAGEEDGGGADGDARGRSPRLGPSLSSGFLNAIEARLGDAIWDAFPLYLRAIGITVQMGRSVEETKRLMARHLRANGLQRHGVPDVLDGGGEPGDGPAPCWEIVQSPLGGRGVIATRDLHPGDLVLVDAPLVLGPRAGSDPSIPAVCVGCLQPRASEALRACSRGCRLPVCASSALQGTACEDDPRHVAECALLRRWGVKGDAGRWSDVLLRVASAVRCLALPPDQREILASMQSHYGRQHASEVGTLLECLESSPKPEEERFMRLACCVMDANAFRMTLPAAEDAARDAARRAAAAHTGETWTPFVGALRGLYPLGALLNHECTPNTRHAYDARGHMVIRVARPVAAGQELTVTYSALLWGSPARRQHLLRTKHFLCACSRCKDPAEGGTFLAALPCPSRGCGGPVLPTAPLSLTGPWRCAGCALDVPAERATLLQSVLGGLLQTLYLNPAVPPQPGAILRFLQDNRHLLPATNHITVELKSDVVWSLGRKPGMTFSELSEEQLRLKEALVHELLGVLRALQAGSCSLSGMLQYELHCTLMERCRRDSELWPVVAGDALHAIEQADEVLAEDNAAPMDLAERLRQARLLPPPSAPPAVPHAHAPHSRVVEACAP
ncbi:SET domain-containing protein SmydA-8-like, partial [Thrips palmi]|uniref:SET domain-containing protein SmydA-8-like n=1 Tax=Thrips palmi TaxID=161013 RepID=A0A6P8YD22_THRPL